MTVTVKNNTTDLIVPKSVRRRAGIKPGADDEYTPEQRRVIDAQLQEAAKNPYYGPFETADAAVRFLRQSIRKRKTGNPRPPSDERCPI